MTEKQKSAIRMILIGGALGAIFTVMALAKAEKTSLG
jgi:hypothetical protein